MKHPYIVKMVAETAVVDAARDLIAAVVEVPPGAREAFQKLVAAVEACDAVILPDHD